MADNILRVALAVPRVTVGAPFENAAEIIRMLEHARPLEPDIVLFPELCISGFTCGHLFGQVDLVEKSNQALQSIVKSTERFDFVTVVSLPCRFGGVYTAASAIIQAGRILAFVPSAKAPAPLDVCNFETDASNVYAVAKNAVFRFGGGASFAVLPAVDLSTPPLFEMGLGAYGCDVILCPAAIPAVAGADLQRALRERADKAAISFVMCGAGAGESTCANVFRGFSAAAEPYGMSDISLQNGLDSFMTAWDIDLDVVRSAKHCAAPVDCITIDLPIDIMSRNELKRSVSRTPYLPDSASDKLARFTELFELQKLALCGRLSGTGIQKIILGVSGGLDSTLALLVAVGACEMLGLPSENIIAVTMPGFGTTDRTYYNALTLISELGVTLQEISISRSVTQHFEDIGHDISLHNATYENAQARERTQILFDIANSEGALVLGTGDMSEIALGWCTFGGDHLAGYGVNTCLTKGMIRGIVENIAALSLSDRLREALNDILDTPISPELIPGGAGVQSTENILGPYELHDFFLFHTIKYGFTDAKMMLYAKAAFSELSENEISRCLGIFRKRFITSQFKRACATESPAITDFNLHDFNFPSDLPTYF